MRNLKRALSLTLASVMLLGMMVIGTSAASFTDADQISNVTAATVLQDLEIMQGSNGKFNPKSTVTRGQMAILICKILYGNRLNVDSLAQEQKFDDVPAGQYYTGYVNFAAEQGIISGYGNGKFGPGAPVSTAQAALMLTRALGYFQAGETADGWASTALKAITLGTKLNLFGDLKLGTNDPLSRDNVAEMVFNTITKANPVEYSEFFKTYYTDMTSPMSGVKFDYRETLGFKNYDLVYKTDLKTDDFGRPATCWGVGRYDVPAIGNAVDAKGNLYTAGVTLLDNAAAVVEPMKADLTYTKGVSHKDLATAVGATPMSYTTWNLFVDGANTSTSAKPTATSTSNYEPTGNGVLTQVYIRSDLSTPEVEVVCTNTYLAQVTQVSSDDDGRYISVLLNNGKAVDDRTFHTDKFAEKDYVLVTVAQNSKGDSYIATVSEPKTAEGKVTAYNAQSSEGYITLDGTRYDCAKIDARDVDNTGRTVDFAEYKLFLDQYGYVTGFQQISAGSDDYLLVRDSSPYVGDYQTRVVFPDGSSKVVLVQNKEAAAGGPTRNTAYRYEIQDNGEYVLYNTTRSGRGSINNAVTAQIDSGKAQITAVPTTDNQIADRNTRFVHVNTATESYAGYVGYNNVPSITSTGLKVVDYNGDGVADIVFAVGGTASNSDSTIYYIADTGSKKWESFKDGDTVYYRYNEAYVDGVKTPMVVSIDVNRDISGPGLYKVLSTNSKGYITDLDTTSPGFNLFAGDGIVLTSEVTNTALAKGTESILLKANNAGSSTQRWTVDPEKTTYVVVDTANKKAGVGSINAITEDDKPNATAVLVAKVDSSNGNLATLVYVFNKKLATLGGSATQSDIDNALDNNDYVELSNPTALPTPGKLTSGKRLVINGTVPAITSAFNPAGLVRLSNGAKVSDNADLSGATGGVEVGNVTVDASKTLTLPAAGAKLDGTVTTKGTVVLKGNVSGSGSIKLDDGTATLDTGVTALPKVTGDGTLNVNGTITNTGNSDITAGIASGAEATGVAGQVVTVNVSGGISLGGSGHVDDYSSTQSPADLAGLTEGTTVTKIVNFTVPMTTGDTKIQTFYYKGDNTNLAAVTDYETSNKDSSSAKWTSPQADSGTGAAAGKDVSTMTFAANDEITVGFYVSDVVTGIRIKVTHSDSTTSEYTFKIAQ